ncbi:MAG TPA: hypothetical protein VMW10_04840 [Alphaproteobacteria bacterium]|nr:hypothetical protein [Alphaproteobacteria bacterium]
MSVKTILVYSVSFFSLLAAFNLYAFSKEPLQMEGVAYTVPSTPGMMMHRQMGIPHMQMQPRVVIPQIQALPHIEPPHLQAHPHIEQPRVHTLPSGPHIEHFQSVPPVTAPVAPTRNLQQFRSVTPRQPFVTHGPQLRHFQSVLPAPQQRAIAPLQQGIQSHAPSFRGQSAPRIHLNQEPFSSNAPQNDKFHHNHFYKRHHHRQNFFYPFFFFPFDSYFISGPSYEDPTYEEQPTVTEEPTYTEEQPIQPNTIYPEAQPYTSGDETYIQNNNDMQKYIDQQKIAKMMKDIHKEMSIFFDPNKFFPIMKLPKPGFT